MPIESLDAVKAAVFADGSHLSFLSYWPMNDDCPRFLQ
jgi:hypothetical protein